MFGFSSHFYWLIYFFRIQPAYLCMYSNSRYMGFPSCFQCVLCCSFALWLWHIHMYILQENLQDLDLTFLAYLCTACYRPQNDSVEIQLDLAYKALTSGGYHINQTAFDIALEEGRFKSRYVSIYLYGYAHPSPVHAVNEISIKGQVRIIWLAVTF